MVNFDNKNRHTGGAETGPKKECVNIYTSKDLHLLAHGAVRIRQRGSIHIICMSR